MKTRAVWVGVVVVAMVGGVAQGASAQLANPGFGEGLAGWTVEQEGGDVAPGAVEALDGAAELLEGDSLLVRLEQSFTAPAGLMTLSFQVATVPGFDTADAFVADAFEAHLLVASGGSAVPTWRAGASAFFSVQEDGSSRTGAGTSFDGTTVTVQLAHIPAGTELRLVFALVGGDDDLGSSVRVDALALAVANAPPTAVAGPDVTVECGVPGGVLLDGAASSDPDLGDVLSYAWTDASGAEIAAVATVTVTPSVGEHTYTLSVSDGEAPAASDDVVVTVKDTVAPEVSGVAAAVEVSAAGACAGSVPDLRVGAIIVDQCGPAEALVVTQEPPPGAALTAEAAVEITVTATDPAGLSGGATATVTLIDLGPDCSTADAAPDSAPDADAATDADAGPDAATNADADAATDTDTAPDADSDADTATDAAAEADTATDADADAGTDTATDTDAGADSDADADTATDTDAAADSDADADTDTATDSDADADTHLADISVSVPDLGESQGKHRSGCDCDVSGGQSPPPPLEALVFGLLWLAMGLPKRRRARGLAANN